MKQFDAEMRPHLLEEEQLIPILRQNFTRREIDKMVERISKHAPWWELGFYLQQLPNDTGS